MLFWPDIALGSRRRWLLFGCGETGPDENIVIPNTLLLCLAAGDNAGRYPDIRAGLRRSSISAVFSDPQIAMVGESFKQLETRLGNCGCFATGEVSFEGQGRSRVMLRNKGILHVYGEQGTGRFLGAEMIGPNAEHLAHLLAWAHQNKMTVSEMLDMPFYHPVIEEGVRTALRDLNAKLHLGPEMIKHCLDCGPGC